MISQVNNGLQPRKAGLLELHLAARCADCVQQVPWISLRCSAIAVVAPQLFTRNPAALFTLLHGLARVQFSGYRRPWRRATQPRPPQLGHAPSRSLPHLKSTLTIVANLNCTFRLTNQCARSRTMQHQALNTTPRAGTSSPDRQGQRILAVSQPSVGNPWSIVRRGENRRQTAKAYSRPPDQSQQYGRGLGRPR